MSQDINTIIEQLAEIDSASAKIMQKAQFEKSKYAEHINEQKKIFDDSLQADINKEVKELEKSMAAQSEELIKQCQIDCDADIEKLDKTFKENGEQWADDIFKNIIRE